MESFGKFWQTVRDGPRLSLNFPLPELSSPIEEIAALHSEKGVYGGAGWANYAVQYFNDSERICKGLQYALRPGGAAVVVLGNSITQGVELKTDRYFGQIGEMCGLNLEAIHMLREKRVGNSVVNSTVRNGRETRATLYETAVVLRKPCCAARARSFMPPARHDPAWSPICQKRKASSSASRASS
jgi:hypothetical protein